MKRVNCCKWKPTRLVLIASLVLMINSGVSFAQSPKTVGLKLMVSHVSQTPGPIDPAAESLHRQLRNDFRYESLHVIESKEYSIPLEATAELTLPNGNFVRVQPLSLNESGLLMAVEVEGMLQTKLRVKNMHQVVIGAQRYKDGKLVVTVQPDYEPSPK